VVRGRAQNETADTGAGMEPKDTSQDSYNQPQQMFSYPAGISRESNATHTGRHSA